MAKLMKTQPQRIKFSTIPPDSSSRSNPNYVLTCLCIHKRSLYVGTESEFGHILVWNLDQLADQPLILMDEHTGPITCIIDMGKAILSSSKDGTIREWKDLHCTRNFSNGKSFPTVIISALFNDQFVIYSGDEDGKLTQWDYLHQELLQSNSTAHSSEITCLQVTPQGDRIISSGLDNAIRVWNSTQLECLYTLDTQNQCILSMALYKDLLMTGSRHGMVHVWNFESQEMIRSIKSHNGHAVNCVFVAKTDHPILFTTGDKVVLEWSMSNWTFSCKRGGHYATVVACAFADNHLYSISRDGRVNCWKMPVKEKRSTHPDVLIENLPSLRKRPSAYFAAASHLGPSIEQWEEAQNIINEQAKAKFKLEAELVNLKTELADLKLKETQKSDWEKEKILLRESTNNALKEKFYKESEMKFVSNRLENILDIALTHADKQLLDSSILLDDLQCILFRDMTLNFNPKIPQLSYDEEFLMMQETHALSRMPSMESSECPEFSSNDLQEPKTPERIETQEPFENIQKITSHWEESIEKAFDKTTDWMQSWIKLPMH